MRYRAVLLLLLFAVCACTHAGTLVTSMSMPVRITPKFYSGLLIQDLSEEIKRLETSFNAGGALVNRVVVGSPAERAGLLRGDVITAVNDTPVCSAQEFVYQLQSDRHGSLEIQLDVYRLLPVLVRRRITLMREPLAKQGAEAQ